MKQSQSFYKVFFSMVAIIYPSDDFIEVADIYSEENLAFQQANSKTLMFDFNAFYEDRIRLKPTTFEKSSLIYRGWMLSPNEYQLLFKILATKGYNLITTPQQYQNWHFLPNWYEHLKAFTPKTFFTDDLAKIDALYKKFDNLKVFVKDYVKSDTSGSSIANSLEEVYQIIDNIKKFRGKIDGGICLREFIELDNNTEERYFVYQKKAFSRDGIVPPLVSQIAEQIDSPFFSVDTCFDTQGKLWLVEIGDGQVSDIKNWQVADFVEIFKA